MCWKCVGNALCNLNLRQGAARCEFRCQCSLQGLCNPCKQLESARDEICIIFFMFISKTDLRRACDVWSTHCIFVFFSSPQCHRNVPRDAKNKGTPPWSGRGFLIIGEFESGSIINILIIFDYIVNYRTYSEWCFHRFAPEGHVIRTEPKQGAKDPVAQFGKIIHLERRNRRWNTFEHLGTQKRT